jgi:SAM-dependent methyltransferase
MSRLAALDATLQRYRLTPEQLARLLPVPPRIYPDGVGLNRVCRLDSWDDPVWRTASRATGMPQGDDRCHRKAWEWAHCVYGLERLGALGDDRTALGVGAGHEYTLYYLANRSRLTVATDLYRGHFASTAAEEADPDFLVHPEHYAPFPYRADRLRALPASGVHLPFRENSFDVVYSLSSIEHFGGHDAATAAMREIARVLRPGGYGCIATELILEGGVDYEYFTIDEFERHVVNATVLVPVEQIDYEPPPRELMDEPIVAPDIFRTPHIVIGKGALRWTSVMVFFRKPTAAELVRAAGRDLATRVARRVRQVV